MSNQQSETSAESVPIPKENDPELIISGKEQRSEPEAQQSMVSSNPTKIDRSRDKLGAKLNKGTGIFCHLLVET